MSKRFMSALLVCVLTSGCGTTPETKPAQTGTYAHQQCGGASPDWAKQGAESGELMTFNVVAVGPDGIRWNRVPIDRTTLATYLEQVRHMAPQPVTVLVAADDASCADIESVRRLMNEKQQCRGEVSDCVEYAQGVWDTVQAPLPPAPENSATG